MRTVLLALLLCASSGCATPALYDWFEGHRRTRGAVSYGPPVRPIAVTRAGRDRDGAIYVEIQFRSSETGTTLRQLRYVPGEAGCPDPSWPSAADEALSDEVPVLTVEDDGWPDTTLIPVAVVCDPDEPGEVPAAALSLELDAARSLELQLDDPGTPAVPPGFAVRLDQGVLELREGAGDFHPIGRIPTLQGARTEQQGKPRYATYVGFFLALPFAVAADAAIAAAYVAAYMPAGCH